MSKNMFLLAPHIDDIEFSCAGTVLKYLEKGYKVFYISFTRHEKSVPDEYPNDILTKELNKSIEVLGIDKENVIEYNFPVREFLNHRQDILEKLINLRDKYNPQIVLLPSSADIHQDHSVIHKEGLRAFKKSTLLGYECIWNNFSYKPSYFSNLKETHIEKKIQAIKKYESQSEKDFANSEFVWSLARTRGLQAGVNYAEAFEVIRIIED